MSVAHHSRRFISIAALAICLVAGALFAGCGSSTSAGIDDAGLSYAPQDAALYITLQTDFNGSQWTQLDRLGASIPGFSSLKKEMLGEVTNGMSGQGLSYSADIKPWLGKHAGIAVLSKSVDLGSAAQSVASASQGTVLWADVANQAKAKKFVTKVDKGAKTSTYDKTTIYQSTHAGSKTYVALVDGALLASEDAGSMHQALNAHAKGTSIADSDTWQSAAGDDDSSMLVSLVATGDSIRSLLTNSNSTDVSSHSLQTLVSSPRIQALKSFSLGLKAEQKGLRLHGDTQYDGSKLGDVPLPSNSAPSLVKNLPAATLAAFGGSNMGDTVKTLVETIEKGDQQVATQIQQLQAVLGFTLNDVESAFKGEYIFGVAPATAPASTPGVPGVAFEAQATDANKASEILQKLFGLAASQSQTPIAKQTIGGFSASVVNFDKFKIFGAVAKGVAVVSNDPSFFTTADGGSGARLAQDPDFTSVVDDASVPNKVASIFYLDVPKLVKLPIVQSLGVAKYAPALQPIGSIIGWTTNNDSDATMDLFLQIHGK